MNKLKKTKNLYVLVVMLPLFLTLLSADTAAAKIYKWVDENGKIHYSDYPPEDAQLNKKTKEIPTYNIRPQSSVKYGGEGNPGGRSFVTAIHDESEQRATHNVELYVTSWCTYCKKARKFFQSRGIPSTEYDIERDREAALRKKRLDPRRGVPFAVINGHRIHGYIPLAYERALQDGA